MHAIHPQFPRMLAALIAAFLLMLVALAAAPQLDDVDFGTPAANPPPAETAAERPTWATDPLASPLERLKTPPPR